VRAFRLTAAGQTGLMTIPDPDPGRSDVTIRIGSASFCHSDLELLDLPPNVPGIPLPLTLGHEMAGWIETTGTAVTGWEVGQPVAVYIIEGCGWCLMCQTGRENLCQRGTIRTPGVHYDGGVAEYMVIDAARLVPLDDVDMAVAAPLTDAGLTSFHAVELARPYLDAASSVLVVGIGGLGHLGLQILAASSAARIIAVDVDNARLDLARRLGADACVVAGSQASQLVKEANHGRAVDVVLDFAGVQASVDLGVDVVKRGGLMVVTGMGGGMVPVVHGFGGPERRLPPETAVVTSFAGSRADLHGVIALTQKGLINVESTQYPLEEVERAWAGFATGNGIGRVVINP
jgi:alcohol dehydrogenase, propanol-preferring